ncbi:hypothetical protein DFP90_1011173 [Aestuariispira insulae]|uniref:Xaa-Pro dipeptidyl-peptidase C-terminal domain-containing protein n=2 Tax=Aestuariispira insulae TaxID=1461337 RepID=A0A3D9HY75_9PROT|nr:hypothetical protein DFP90_1011173 [Aestuariispira insulae]
MQTITDFQHEVEEFENIWIPMPDGVQLAARLWKPKGSEQAPVPAILEHLPYRKGDGTRARDNLTHPYMAGHGYACIRVDMRGNGNSDGLMEDEYSQQELDDAVSVINWLCDQVWCDGNVGMMGISWGGFNGLQVAAMQPPALKAVITLCSTDDRYADDIHYKGGCLLNENLGWGATMLSYSSRPPDPAHVGEKWREIWLERLENQPLLSDLWLRHQTRDDYWKHGSVCEDYAKITAAVLAVGGWADAYSNAIPRLLSNLKSPARGIIGPWIHKYPHFATPEPRIGFLQEALRWWDKWLKGIETGVMHDATYTAYMMDGIAPKTSYSERPGHWVTEPEWPSDNIQMLPFFLNHGLLQQTADPWRDMHYRSPQDTGQASGEFCPIWMGADMPGDQRVDDAGSLCFDGAPAVEDIELFGAPVLDLEVAVDQPKALIAARLCDVGPDGASSRITYGLLNLCHRQGHDRPEDMPVGKPVRLRLQLDDIAYRLPKGHHLRLSLSTAYWPMVWPSPKPVTITIEPGKSILELPMRMETRTDNVDFPPPEGASPQQRETLREASNSRTVMKDMESGVSILTIEDDFGLGRDLDTGLATGSTAREVYRIHPDNPLSANMETSWTQELIREGWHVRTATELGMWSDETHFHISASLEAFEDDKRIFEKHWKETIPRDWL